MNRNATVDTTKHREVWHTTHQFETSRYWELMTIRFAKRAASTREERYQRADDSRECTRCSVVSGPEYGQNDPDDALLTTPDQKRWWVMGIAAPDYLIGGESLQMVVDGWEAATGEGGVMISSPVLLCRKAAAALPFVDVIQRGYMSPPNEHV